MFASWTESLGNLKIPEGGCPALPCPCRGDEKQPLGEVYTQEGVELQREVQN